MSLPEWRDHPGLKLGTSSEGLFSAPWCSGAEDHSLRAALSSADEEGRVRLGALNVWFLSRGAEAVVLI